MNDLSAPAGLQEQQDDAAWASINTPLSADELAAFCNDIERLFRINPMLEFSKWGALGNNHYVFAGRNISQETPFEFDIELTVRHRPGEIQVDYTNGIKSRTVFKIEPADLGSKLTIIDHYQRLSEDERAEHLHQVDKSIGVWARDLQRYLISWQRWSRYVPWRWYMRRVWQPMKPTARRITYMLLWISAVEVALILLGVAIYFAEYA